MSTGERVAGRLARFRPVRSTWLRRFINLALLCALITLLLNNPPPRDEDERVSYAMFQVWMATAGLELLLLKGLFRQVGRALLAVWQRGLIQRPRERRRLLLAALRPWPDGESAEAAYLRFLDDLERLMNHPLAHAMGGCFALIMAALIGSRVPTLVNADYGPFTYLLAVAVGVGLLCGACLAGMLVWRMIVIAIRVYDLGHMFDLNVQPEHPDKSGGLKPIGDLCFANALIVTLPGIVIGGWVAVLPRLIVRAAGSDFEAVFVYWSQRYTFALGVVIALALVTFFLPLIGIHRVMVAEREEMRRRLDALSLTIARLSRELLERADQLDAKQGAELEKRIDFMRRVYARQSAFPVWPFDRAVVVKLITSQSLPLLSLTGIAPGVVKVLSALLSFVK